MTPEAAASMVATVLSERPEGVTGLRGQLILGHRIGEVPTLPETVAGLMWLVGHGGAVCVPGAGWAAV